jgi:hypothetical protein
MKFSRPYGNDIVVVEDFLTDEESLELNNLVRNVSEDRWDWKGDHEFGELSPDFQRKTLFMKSSEEYRNKYMPILNAIHERAISAFYKEFPGQASAFTFLDTIIRTFDNGLTLHADGSDLNSNRVTHGFVAYLNDDFEGGDVYYPTLDIVLKPIKNALVIHPGTMEYIHGVTDVTAGVRFNLAFFALK